MEDSQREEETFKCVLCSKTFVSLECFKIHSRTGHASKVVVKSPPKKVDQQSFEIYKCEKCDKVFRAKSSLNLHIKSVHKSIRVACNTCGKLFSQISTMKRHVRVVHEHKKIPCPFQCRKTFSGNTDVKKHVNRFHYGIGDWYWGKSLSPVVRTITDTRFHHQKKSIVALFKQNKRYINNRSPGTFK